MKDRVEAGAESGAVLVLARCDGALRQFLVPTDAPGVTVTTQDSIDLVKRYARIEFDGVEVDTSAAVGDAEQTPAIVERQRQIALVLQCAEIVGILEAVLAMTNQWLVDRHSFGRPLASYQALKHRAADMKMWFEAARGTTAGAVAAVSARADDAPLLVSVAKAYVAERAPVMLQDCVQLHGGIGVTWEHDLHLYLRRISLYRAMFGAPEDHHRAVYALSRKSDTPHDRDGDSARDHRVGGGVRRARPCVAGREHAAHRPGQPAVLRARRAAVLGSGQGTAEAVVRRRFRGHLLPREYGGLGLDFAYQKAFNDECRCYEMPLILNTPSFTICAATILDVGSEQQKRERISAAIRGDEILVQLLSEPSGGSDLAGVITRADRKDDKWIINGAKT